MESRCFDSVTVLIQKEVAQRICAAPGTADYGAFSLLMQYYTAPELVFEVPNTCFLPAPKVTSAVIHCPGAAGAAGAGVQRGHAVADGAGGVRPAAQDPGEQSANRAPPWPKDQLAAIVTGCGLPEKLRGERLSLAGTMRPWPTPLAAVM